MRAIGPHNMVESEVKAKETLESIGWNVHKKYHFSHHPGMPDFLCYEDDRKDGMYVEVKSEKDRLNYYQVRRIKEILEAGTDVWLLRVMSDGTKKIKRMVLNEFEVPDMQKMDFAYQCIENELVFGTFLEHLLTDRSFWQTPIQTIAEMREAIGVSYELAKETLEIPESTSRAQIRRILGKHRYWEKSRIWYAYTEDIL